MAQKTIISLTDDLNGGEANQTVEFALDGATYEIDLSDDNAERLRGALSEFTGSARRVGGRIRRNIATGTAKAVTDKAQLQAIREWGRENGFTVNDRGRLSGELVEAYKEAHAPKPAPKAAPRATAPKATAPKTATRAGGGRRKSTAAKVVA